MSVVAAIAFVVIVLCFIVQIPLWSGFRRSMMDRHPEVWAEVSRTWFVDHAIMAFATSDRLKQLDDPALSRTASRLKWLRAILVGSFIVMGVSLALAEVR